jgi:predicted amidohydrolase YtcJ
VFAQTADLILTNGKIVTVDNQFHIIQSLASRNMAVGSNSDLEKLADLLILDRDYLTIPADEIKDIKPLLTMVSGKVVYEVGSK